ncbi:trans-2-enoyl-CoA reductase family protein [Vibrio sp. S4M6]|uniref:enoyl-ACP reductase FabV n=1 Tax=Vibrio sinus TaxID=2946865 RepID=UPI00202A127F|nr:enoyl-ACP reductase FabV [Vibrio sinus]MCL9783193.1 trans-2-enoyl-CoA reductase family protein [Vibrio sinus]
MIVEPIINGLIAKTAHPIGCEKSVANQINYIRSKPAIIKAPKRVLVLGASSGFGLSARIALTFAGNAETIGVSLERAPTANRTGSAGWYNNLAFKHHAEKSGKLAINIQGDAFSEDVREQVIEAIETYFEGEVDLVIYSLASRIRPKPNSDCFWRSSIKPIQRPYKGHSILFEDSSWHTHTLPPAINDEIESTRKVMGGEDWESWIDTLINSESIARGCRTVAFSYIGPESTYPIYLDGTLGRAKIDLQQTSHALNLKLANFAGNAFSAVCKANVTKASVIIPGFTPYLCALYKVMKQEGLHETCIEQMYRLFADKVYSESGHVPVDGERLIRTDDWELKPYVQRQVNDILSRMNAENFAHIADYTSVKNEFLQLNGFAHDGIDYSKDIDLLKPS